MSRPKFLRISPNEVENAIKEASCKRRKFRLLQVRAQAKEQASKLRQLAKEEEEKQKNLLRQTLKAEWNEERDEKLEQLHEKYEACISDFGEAHKKAEREIYEAVALAEKKVQRDKAIKQLGLEAIRNLGASKALEKENENVATHRRQKIRQSEKLRAQKISKMPTPERFKAKKKPKIKTPKKVMFHEAGTFTTSSYIPSVTTVRKESSEDHLPAHEAAARKLEEEEVVKKRQREKEVEERMRREERGKAAEKREKLKELQLHLINELEKMDEQHQLSDYLKGEESSDTIAANSGDDSAGRSKKQEAERLVSEILKQEHYEREAAISRTMPRLQVSEALPDRTTDHHLISSLFDDGDRHDNGITSDTTDKSTEVSDKEDESAQKQSVEGHRSLFELSSQQDIHMKSTIPVHKLPIVIEKFKTSKSVMDRLGDRTSVDDGRYSPPPMSSDYGTSDEVEEISLPPSSSSYETEYLELSDKLKERLKKVEKKDKTTGYRSIGKIYEEVLNRSSSSTEYLGIPDSLPVNDSGNLELAWENLRRIQGRRKKAEDLISKIMERQISPDKVENVKPEYEIDGKENKKKSLQINEKEFQTFKTPPKIYSEDIKLDGSGDRPVSRKEKFEHCKKAVLEHYVKKVLAMKLKDLQHLSVSSVEGSGFDLSSHSNVCDLLKSKLALTDHSPRSSLSPCYSSTPLSINDDEIDTIPVKLHSTEASNSISQYSAECQVQSLGAETPLVTTPSSTSSTHFSESECQTADSDLQQDIQRRLKILDQMRQVILCKLHPGNAAGSTDAIGPDVSPVAGRGESKALRDDSLTDSSLPSSYLTPSREDSTTLSHSDYQSGSMPLYEDIRFQDISSQHTQLPTVRFKDTGHQKMLQDLNVLQQLVIENKSHHLCGKFSGSTKKESKLESRTQLNIADVSPASAVPAKSQESSSSNSMPDMTQVLERFGLQPWAHSMERKMDEAEDLSTDSAKCFLFPVT